MRSASFALLVTAALAVGTAEAAERVAIICSGTSLTNGYVFDPTPYPQRLSNEEGVPVVNFGINGDRLANIIARWRTWAKPFPYRALVAEGGTNDLASQVATGAQLWSTFRDWIEEAQDAGFIVVLVLIPPRSDAGWTGGMETERLAFNAAAVAYQATHTSVRIINSDVLLGDGGSPVQLNPAYRCGDKLHICSEGMQVLAEAVADKL